jgi:arylsulfatase
LFWQFGQAKALRQGKWKLVKFGMRGWELYDVEKDPTELNDLASQNERRVKRMVTMWEEWFASHDHDA